MSEMDGTCEYVLDPDDPETWGGEEGDQCHVDEGVLDEDGVWTCPHNAEEGTGLCIYHLPVEKKDNETVVNSFLELNKKDDTSTTSEIKQRDQQFIGAKFGKFDISGENIESKSGNSIIMTHTEFFDECIFSQSTIDGDISLKSAKFHKQADFSGAIIKDKIDFEEADFLVVGFFPQTQFNDSVNFENSSLLRADFYKAKFKNEVDFKFVTFADRAEFTEVLFDKQAQFFGCKFHNNVNFVGSNFKDKALFKAVDFKGKSDFNSVEFNSGVSFQSATFDERAEFFGSLFSEVAEFTRATFNSSTEFNRVTFKDNTSFNEVNIQSEFNMFETEFQSKLTFESSVFNGDSNFIECCFNNSDFSETKFNSPAVFDGSLFRLEMKFTDSEFNSGVSFSSEESETTFSIPPDFSNADITEVDFSKTRLKEANFYQSNLTDAILIHTDFRHSNLENARLSRATLLSADLRGAKLNGAVLGDVRINEDTKFLGHHSDDSNTSPHTLSAIRSRPICVYDPDYEEKNEHEDVDKAQSVYRALEELGGKHARPRLQARSFVRRKDLQKKDYWNDATAEDASLEQRLIAGARWSRARVARATLLYGESPWRVITCSLGIILSFALLYPLGGWMKAEEASEPVSYSQIPVSFLSEPLGWFGGFLNILADSLYYSTLTYTALGFGDFQPEGFGRLLTTIETGLGAVLIALLVFVLGRRAAR